MGNGPGAIVHRPTAWGRKGKSPQTNGYQRKQMEKPGVGRTAPEHFQFCFYLQFRNWGLVRHTPAIENKWDRDLNRTGYWTARLTVVPTIYQQRQQWARQHKPQYYARQLILGLGRQAWWGWQALWDALPRHSSQILLYSYRAVCAKGPRQQQLKQQSRVVVLCSEWPTALREGVLHRRRKPGL